MRKRWSFELTGSFIPVLRLVIEFWSGKFDSPDWMWEKFRYSTWIQIFWNCCDSNTNNENYIPANFQTYLSTNENAESRIQSKSFLCGIHKKGNNMWMKYWTKATKYSNKRWLIILFLQKNTFESTLLGFFCFLFQFIN